jgi:hypothetical protein
VLIYLVEPKEGGETAFPNSQWISPEVGAKLSQGFSDCAKVQVCAADQGGGVSALRHEHLAARFIRVLVISPKWQ